MMNYLRLLFPGILVWLGVSATFYLSGLIGTLKNNFKLQASIVLIMIILYSFISSSLYYKNGPKTHGLVLGIIMSLTALLLDVLITVPYVEIPNGRSYFSFFTSPFLWLLVSLNIITVYVFWKTKIKPKF